MERLGQNFNFAGVKMYFDLLMGRRYLAIPHLRVRHIGAINWGQLKAAGIKGCVFDKDNTLTKPFKTELEADVAKSLAQCTAVFGDKVVLFSNSAGLEQYDPEGKEAAKLERILGIHVLRHSEKKPSGRVSEVEEYLGSSHYSCKTRCKLVVCRCKSESVAMIGDRLLTDVVFGNLNGMLTIYVDPFELETEPPGVRLGRQVENRLWSDCNKKGIKAPPHELSVKLNSFLVTEA